MIKLYTIGFTKKNAQQFFELLTSNEVQEIVDTRVNNKSQLAGYAKGVDLKYFAKAVANIEYSHELDFAPTKELLSQYRKKKLSWEDYEVHHTREVLKLSNGRRQKQPHSAQHHT